MYIKNISQILKTNAPLRIKLFEGSTISGKVLSYENGKGTIKLYDGTIIPAIFISENDIEKDKYIKFIVRSFDGDNFLLKVLEENETSKNEKSLNTIIRDLNIPFEEGKDIILTLIKFNLPASNENISSIYKNMSFINNIKNMSDNEIIFFLREHFNKAINSNSLEFKLAKDIISNLKSVDKNFLSFMLENDIPHNLENMDKTLAFMNNKFFLNSFIDNIKNLLSDIKHEDFNPLSKFINLSNAKPSAPEGFLIDALIRNLSSSIGMDKENITVSSFEEAATIFKENKDLFSFSSSGTYQKLLDSFDLFKQISPNYSLYFFNLYEGSNIFKNNIIIKNKYKGSKYIDINDVKAYITVDTQNLGTVEGNLYKKNDDISISFVVSSEHTKLFQNNTYILKNTLKDYGYNLINVLVQDLNKDKSVLPFSDFFNESILKELDVKV